MICIYSEILFGHKKERNPSICATWMGFEDIMLSEVSQAEQDKYCMISHVEFRRTKSIKADQICGCQRQGMGYRVEGRGIE